MGKAKKTETTSVLLQGIWQRGEPEFAYFERFGLIIPCDAPQVFEVDAETLANLQTLYYIRIKPVDPNAPPVVEAPVEPALIPEQTVAETPVEPAPVVEAAPVEAEPAASPFEATAAPEVN